MIIGVCGQVSAGKSSFVNSLFGENKCKTRLSRCTTEIQKISAESSFVAAFASEIWDFPGVNDGEDKTSGDKFLNMLFENMASVDVLLYITSADTAFTLESEVELFKRIRERKSANNIVATGPYHIAVIVNKSDTEDEELEEIYDTLPKKLSKIPLVRFSSHYLHLVQMLRKGKKIDKSVPAIKKMARNTDFSAETFDDSLYDGPCRELQVLLLGYSTRISEVKIDFANDFANLLLLKIYDRKTAIDYPKILEVISRLGKSFVISPKVMAIRDLWYLAVLRSMDVESTIDDLSDGQYYQLYIYLLDGRLQGYDIALAKKLPADKAPLTHRFLERINDPISGFFRLSSLSSSNERLIICQIPYYKLYVEIHGEKFRPIYRMLHLSKFDIDIILVWYGYKTWLELAAPVVSQYDIADTKSIFPLHGTHPISFNGLKNRGIVLESLLCEFIALQQEVAKSITDEFRDIYYPRYIAEADTVGLDVKRFGRFIN